MGRSHAEVVGRSAFAIAWPWLLVAVIILGSNYYFSRLDAQAAAVTAKRLKCNEDRRIQFIHDEIAWFNSLNMLDRAYFEGRITKYQYMAGRVVSYNERHKALIRSGATHC